MDSATAHDDSSKSSHKESSILRDFSPDLGFCSPSPTDSLSDFQDESERIEGSRFIFFQIIKFFIEIDLFLFNTFDHVLGPMNLMQDK